MEKKMRNIYEVQLYVIEEWDEENEVPTELNPVLSEDGIDPSYTSARISDAYRYYLSNKEKYENDDNYCFELDAQPIEVTDEEWNALLKKGELEYSDYSKYIIDRATTALAWESNYEYCHDGSDSALEELLIVESENFNMRVVCEKAGINYSTFRGFKNNKQPFSTQKKYQLLKTMHAIGNDCWNEALEKECEFYKMISRKYGIK